MSTIHDPAYRAALQKRLRALKADSPRQWGSMTPSQELRWLLKKLWEQNSQDMEWPEYYRFAMGRYCEELSGRSVPLSATGSPWLEPASAPVPSAPLFGEAWGQPTST